MRTTLTLDEDVAGKLRRLARQRRASFKEIVNSVLRRGLARQEPSRKRAAKYRVRTFRSAFRGGIDVLRLNTMNDELEVGRAMGKRR
ncbi:MAG: type II toxin-antitoxin system antitoxin VapB33 [Candidatus Binatia bacterium]